MVNKVEKLIKIVGKGNLLEALFIFLGSFQHANLTGYIDHRNHIGLPSFVRKEGETLDKYFNLKFSLQGLFLIYTQAYKILSRSNDLSTQDVIDEICKVIKESELGKDINEVVDGRQLDLLNVLANPKRDPRFKTVEDFENKVLIDVRKLLREENILNNKYDREFALNKCIIDFYYSIHQDIKADKDAALLFSIGSNYEKLSSFNKEVIVKREVLELLDKNIMCYTITLADSLHYIKLSNRDRIIEYTINHESVDQKEENFKKHDGLYPINTKNTLKQLLQNQNSDEFEQLVTNPENIYYSDEYRPNFIINKKKDKGYRNTFCKLALGMFILSVGLYAADYFLMEQKLFNSMKPQTNLIIAAVLTIVVVYALFQLLKLPRDPPHSAVNGAVHENLMQSHAR